MSASAVDATRNAPKLGDVDDNAIAAWSAARSEPDWLLQARLAAWRHFTELPLPDRHVEEWNRLDLKPLPLTDFHAHCAAEPAASAADLPAGAQASLAEPGTAHALVQADGTPVWRQVGDELQQQGVVFCDLATAVREHGDKVQAALGQAVPADTDKFTALAAALWSGGFFVYVPRNIELELPLQTLRWRTAAGDSSFSRTLVLVDEGASCTLIESQGGASEQVGLDANVVELRLEQGARLKYTGLQNWDENTWSFVQRRGVLGPKSSLTWSLGEFGGRTARSATLSEHSGRGGESNIITVFFSSGRQHHDIYETNLHTGTDTTANMDVRGALSGKGRCVFRGDIEIRRGAHNTSSFEAANALILENGARADAIPSLYIDDNEVQASHSATTGQVDESQLFYLMSRGLSEKSAKKLIVRGFFEPIMGQVPLESVRQEFERLIEEKLG